MIFKSDYNFIKNYFNAYITFFAIPLIEVEKHIFMVRSRNIIWASQH